MQVTRTYLELPEANDFRSAFGDFQDVVVERVANPTSTLYRRCYQTVGRNFHWRDRWDWTDAEIRAHLAQPGIELHTATRAGALVGWYELRGVPEDRSVEIAYFGLFPDAIGRGLGKHLLSCAVRDAWASSPPPARVWLHTCTLDHPAALPNYMARGFRPYKTEAYEVEESRLDSPP
jgi:GNAT superfamily N-acetyltransferase